MKEILTILPKNLSFLIFPNKIYFSSIGFFSNHRRPNTQVKICFPVSTSCHKSPAKDLAGPKLQSAIAETFPRSQITFKMIVTDSFPEIVNALKMATQLNVCDVVFTVGGTGFSPSDVTPEATRAVIEKEATGLSFALISKSLGESKLFYCFSGKL